MHRLLLCAPDERLSCFACCPPIRPPGYDHADHRSSLTRLLSENRTAYLKGQLPDRAMTGYWCAGLGFLDANGQRVGCLLHPAMNQGQDLRGPTGYAEKCARESCAEARSFARLEPQAQNRLIDLCAGMDPFTFSSRALNPVMNLLGMGPSVAKAAASLQGLSVEELHSWPWLESLSMAMGWLVAAMVDRQGPELLREPELAGQVKEAAREIRQALSPQPPINSGQPLHVLMEDETQARFWRALLKRSRARESEIAAWDQALRKVVGD